MKSIKRKQIFTILIFIILFLTPLVAQSAEFHYDDLNRLEYVVYDNNSVIIYTYDEVGNRVTKEENYLGLSAIASFTAEPSEDTDFVVTFNSSGSSCFENTFDPVLKDIITTIRVCDYSWDFGGPGNIIGGNGYDITVFQYDSEGSYNATLTVTDQMDPSITDSDTQIVSAVQHVDLAPPINFVSVVNGNEVILFTPDLSIEYPEVVRAYIYWGDRARTVISYPFPDLVNGVPHVYERGGRSYNMRVTIIDSAHNMIDYTISDDPDLVVFIP